MTPIDTLNPDWLLDNVAAGEHHNPHEVLGIHPHGKGYFIRTRRPLARTVSAEFSDGTVLELEHLRSGIWSGYYQGEILPYEIRATYENAVDYVSDDGYRHQPLIGALDLHLIAEGRHEQLWEKLGAHLLEDDGVSGVVFTVWAPNARAVRVIGSFNNWDGTVSAMRSMGGSGVWELFIPGAAPGDTYKFQILTRDGRWLEKADPMAREAEVPPATASVVTVSDYIWSDQDWLQRRAKSVPSQEPMSIYELHVGSWRPGIKYRELADPLIDYVQELGFTHVEFMPLAEHPFGGSWGYQVTGYYAATSRFGSPDDLKYLIDRLHQAGIGVIMDWVPGHFPKDAWALGRFDGEALYEDPDPRRGEHKDWGTYIFNYGRKEVRNFLVANALFWLSEFHVDALRVDAVASMLYLDYSREEGQWLPNIYGGRENLEAIAFLQETCATAYKLFPGIALIAEESTSYPGVTAPTDVGGLGFGFKWNMGWMNDSLRYFERDPLYRGYHHQELTFSFIYAFNEHFILPISHDEVVHGKGSLLAKMPGDMWQKRANLRAFLAYMWGHPGKKLLFMGQEFGQLSEWSEARSLDWWMLEQPSHRQLANFVSDLNHRYRAETALWERDRDDTAFRNVPINGDYPTVLAFARKDYSDNWVVIACNFSGVPIYNAQLRLPQGGEWSEVLNTDAIEYGGSGVGNLGLVTADGDGNAELVLPPLGVLWLKQ